MSGDLRIIKTKRTIKNALVDLMAQKEFSDITISELSERAMINRKTFYRHYRTISDVVADIENEILSEFSAILKSSNASVLDVGSVFRAISDEIDSRRDFFTKLMVHNPDIFNNGKIKAMLRRALYVSLKSSGDVRDEETLAAVCEFTVSGVLSLYADWFDKNCTGDLDKLTEISAKIVSEGLRGFVSDEKLSAIRLK